LDLFYMKAHQLNSLLKKREVSSREICSAIAERVGTVEEEINGYITFDEDELFRQADEADRYIAQGEEIGPFTGIPVAIKDNFSIKGMKMTCASRMLKDFIAVYNATSVKKLSAQRFVISGKANMDEFAMGSSNETSYFGPVKNPWDLSKVSGGSSGGAAATVASGTAICSLGSDTGGSVREPASFCGLVGFKPTYGRISRYGIVAFASSLDQVGPLTRDIRDCADLLNQICFHDPLDSTSIDAKEQDFTSFLDRDIRNMRIGVIKELMDKIDEPIIADSIKKVIAHLEKEGAMVEEVSLPLLDYALSIYYIISASEASSNLSKFDGVRFGYRDKDSKTLRMMYRRSRSEGFGDEVKRRIMTGTFSLSSGYYDAYYEKAQKARTLIVNGFSDAFKEYDALICPTTPMSAFGIKEKVDDLISRADFCTTPVNLAGLPALSMPVGLSKEGLPIGLQLISDILREDNIIKLGSFIEKACSFDHIPRDKKSINR
jgi:aspartyl-tRNA(Asn)/glutamyl-tRNA(Gln) amidotransferase subunit A